MEEEKKEIIGSELKPEKHKFNHFGHGSLSEHKVMRAVLLGVAIFIIFSIGVGVGSHSNNYSENNYRFSGKGDFEQRGFGMMSGERFQNRNNSACPMQEKNNQNRGGGCALQDNANQIQDGGCRMINQAEIQATLLVPVVQVKTATSTIVK